MRWGARLAPKSIGQSPAPKFNSYEAQAIAFSVLGVYIVVQGIALLWQDVVKYFLDHTWRSGTGSIAVAIEPFLPSVIKIVLGIVLFLRGRGLALVWHKLRSGGRYREPDQETNVSE